MRWLRHEINCLAACAALLALPVAAAPACDRSCLSGYLTKYLEALVAHDPARLPLARGARFTENGVPIPLGEALWVTISALGPYRVDYLDPQSGQAATHVDFREGERGGLLALRLRIVAGRITEIETVLNRGAPMAMHMPPAESAWTEAEPAANRLTRAQLARETENYLRAVSTSNGRVVKFNRDSCLRLENGNVMAYGPNDRPRCRWLRSPISPAGSTRYARPWEWTARSS